MLPKLNRRGSATVVALIFMVLLAALAAGFGSLVSTSIQVSKNEQAIARAQAAAESGLQVIKDYLTQVNISSGTADNQISTQVEAWLQTHVSGTKDAGNNVFAQTDVSDTVSGGFAFPMPTAPGVPRYFQLHPNRHNGGFYATITRYPLLPDPLQGLNVAVTGIDAIRTDRQPTVTRQINVCFAMQNSLGLFTNGVFSEGGIVLSGTGGITGDPSVASLRSILPVSVSTTSVQLSSGSTSVAGNVYVENASQVDNKGTISGQIIEPTSIPPLPTFDPTVFKNLATGGNYDAALSGTTFTNVQIPANLTGTAKTITIDAGNIIKGILYVGANNVIVVKNATLNCVVVIEHDTNLNKYRSAFTMTAQGTLNGIPSTDPSLASVANALKGYAVLAPTTDVTVTANGVINGSIVAYSATMNGGGDVDVVDGTILTLSPVGPAAHGNNKGVACTLNGNGNFHFTRTAGYKPPTTGMIGEIGSRYFTMDNSSYQEGSLAP